MTGVVRLDGATFTYPGADRPVLQDISLTALPGTTTAIVGSTGSGKSTLVSLICRLYDVTAGAVLVDDVDVRDYDTERLWSAIGLVPQRGYLFSGTVADNLRYGKADATDEEMWEALRVADADGFVRAHDDGLQMRVAQGGINFSGGPAATAGDRAGGHPPPRHLLVRRRVLRAGCAHRRTGARVAARDHPATPPSSLSHNAFRPPPRPTR